MRIKNKLFPYPVLHQNVFFSNYNQSEFKLSYDDKIQDGLFLLENICITLSNPELKEMLNDGVLKCACIVECPQSMYRKTFEISETPRTIEIQLFNLIGKLEISAFLYALDAINEFSSNDFDEVYKEYTFDVEKYCIMAIDNGLKQRIEFESKDDKKKSSIFVLITDLDENAKTIKWSYDENLVKISIPKLQHSEYDTIKSVSRYKNIFLSQFAVTPLSFILSDFITEQISVDELEYNYKWFKSFNDAYAKTFDKRLNDEEFLQMDNVKIYSVVQEIFDYCIIKGVDDLYTICNEGVGGIDED